MNTSSVNLVLVFLLKLIPSYANDSCDLAKSNITCDFWERMVSQHGIFFNQSLICMDYKPYKWSNMVMGVQKPQEVFMNLETIEVLLVDETSKVGTILFTEGISAKGWSHSNSTFQNSI